MADALHFVDANGLKFAYLEEGTGPLVLMLHGFPDTAHTWDDLRSRIAAKGYRAVSPFMRGYHPTAIPDRDADQETLARDALALIEALGASEAVVIGHDFGAWGRLRRGGARPRSSNEAVRSRHSPPGRAQAVAETALGRPPLRGLQVAGGTEPLRAQRLRGTARDLQAMVAGLGPRPERIRSGAGELLEPRELERGVRLLPKAVADTHCITEDANHRAHGRVCRAR